MPDVTIPTEIQVPAGNNFVFSMYAIGIYNDLCRYNGSGGSEWIPVGPEAYLLNDISNYSYSPNAFSAVIATVPNQPLDGTVIITMDSIVPNDTSGIIYKKYAVSASTDPSNRESALFKVFYSDGNGTLLNITYIQEVSVSGGVHPNDSLCGTLYPDSGYFGNGFTSILLFYKSNSTNQTIN
ncbi:30413_t:CDS:2 [Gigaspora margarita]|uniref:30413_t:CDS:1 n=1 Tax=Gigaspora margarita TaxID=4874 RepID=A0ABN7UZT3_GIGMA|nr:30413_t:CDS:2 [Gigaspora margarita]